MSEYISGVTTRSTGTLTSTFTRPNAAGTRTCKVVGCNVDLEALGKPYCLKKRVCVRHIRADAVKCEVHGDQLMRFCQQCGKLEPLQRFEGMKRSCREGLKKRRVRECRPATPPPDDHEGVEEANMVIDDATDAVTDNNNVTDGLYVTATAQTAVAAPWMSCTTEQQKQWPYPPACQPQICSGKTMSFPGNLITAGSAEETAVWVSPAATASPTAAAAVEQAAAHDASDDTEFMDALLQEALTETANPAVNPALICSTSTELETLLETELLAAAVAAGDAAIGRREMQCQTDGFTAAAPNHSHGWQQQQLMVAAAAAETSKPNMQWTRSAPPAIAMPLPPAAAAAANQASNLQAMQLKLVQLEYKLLGLLRLKQQLSVARRSCQGPAAAADAGSCTAVQGYFPVSSCVQGYCDPETWAHGASYRLCY